MSASPSPSTSTSTPAPAPAWTPATDGVGVPDTERTTLNGNGNGNGAALPFTFTDPTPASVQAALDEAEDDAPLSGGHSSEARILRHALEWAVAHADVELVGYLAGLDGRLGTNLDTQVAALEDDEGWGVVGMAIQSSCGLSDKEEAVRLIVARWGVSAGPRGGRDRSGWTALHLAALLSSPQIVSVLLNRGASPAALTDGGLSAYDLITGMEGREPLALLLDPLHDDAPASDAIGRAPDRPPLSPRRRELIQRRRFRATTRSQLEERRAAQARMTAERERWVRERAKNIGVNASVLFPEPKLDEEEEGGDDDEEEEDAEEFLNPSNALVFSLNQLGFIFDIFITKYSPLCQPQERRALPANALYLYARFAHYQCDEAWLEELVDGAIERIERGVYSNGDDLAYLAFWEYNLTLLLGLIRLDEPLFKACTAMSLLGMVEELINAIHVFVIRIAERKIDEVLDAAMLDFESLEDFDDVRFADQWNLFRSFTSRKKTRETPLAASVFSAPSTPDRPDPLESPHRTTGPGLPSPSPSSTGRSILDLKAEAREVIATGIEKAGQVVGLGGDKPSPSRVVDVLTNVLLILQLYDVNPAFIVQVFSQTFYWISSELFNRIITRRKYLCRTKALQIRMNLTALEDWTRQNGLPPNIATKHLEHVMQLLQWLQCLSQINQFDMLIGTVQNLRALNPLQMRRAVRDYRFEVNESRMADDCVQYLAQMQKDWERRRVHIGVKNAQQSQGAAADGDDPLSIEALFDGTVGIGEWVPQTSPECLGELVDSRFMLPFLIPTSTEFLLATPPPDEAYRNLATELPLLPDGTISNRPLSRASYSSSRPMAWASQHEKRVRRLPEHFFEWLNERQAEFVRQWGTQQGGERKKVKSDVKITPTRPAPPPPAPDTGSKPVPSPPLPALPEQYVTPQKALPRAPNSPVSTPSRELARKASVDLAHAQKATPPGTDSIEMVFRPSPSPATYANGSYAIPAVDLGRTLSNGSPVVSPNGSPHYELARLRRERKASVSSVHSNSSAGGEKKRWWKLGRMGSMGSDGEASLERERERRRAEREDTAETIVPSPSARRTSTSDTVKTLVPSPVRSTQSIFETEDEVGRRL